jgi:hypothetical protein
MKSTLLVAALFAVALSACGKKEEAATALPAPATPPALPAAAPEAPKPADGALPAAAPAEQKPAGEEKTTN